MRNRLLILVIIFIFSMIGFISIGYSAFNTNLSISGDAIVRRDADIRITDLKLTSKSNGGTETYSAEFSKSLVSMNVNLPASNSSITYTVKITNKTGKYFLVNSISEVVNSNANVKYSLSGMGQSKIYSGDVTFDITFTTSSVNQNKSLTLKFDFSTINQSEWNYSFTKGEQSFVAPYDANYKLEVWGASGGDTKEDNRGGYGGYSVGTIPLTLNKKIFINVGGSGLFPNVVGTVDGGYNGGAIGSLRQDNAVWGGSGGGATHIAYVSGLLSTLSSSYSTNLIIAAGGGGGGETYMYNDAANYSGKGGSGGGYIGGNGVPNTTIIYGYGTGGTQTAGGSWHQIDSSNGGNRGSFGLGAQVVNYTGAGGGGGFYGGGTLEHGVPGGGSGYINNSSLTNKSMYCFDCPESTDVGTYTVSTTGTSSLRDTVNCSQGFSTSAVSKCAKDGDGYVRISLAPAN